MNLFKHPLMVMGLEYLHPEYVKVQLLGLSWLPTTRSQLMLLLLMSTEENSRHVKFPIEVSSLHPFVFSTIVLLMIYILQAIQGGEVGFVIDCEWAEPLSDKIEDQAAAARRIDFQLGWYMLTFSANTYEMSYTSYLLPQNIFALCNFLYFSRIMQTRSQFHEVYDMI